MGIRGLVGTAALVLCLLAGSAAGAVWPIDGAAAAAPQRPLVLVDQVGYDTRAPKRAIVQGSDDDHFKTFRVIDIATGKVVRQGAPQAASRVDHWHGWHYLRHAPGAIINGITSGLNAEDDGVAFDLVTRKPARTMTGAGASSGCRTPRGTCMRSACRMTDQSRSLPIGES